MHSHKYPNLTTARQATLESRAEARALKIEEETFEAQTRVGSQYSPQRLYIPIEALRIRLWCKRYHV